MRSKAEANRFYAVLTGCVLSGLVLLSVTVWLFRPADLDPDTLCPTSRPVAGHTVAIVDRTDRWTPGMESVWATRNPASVKTDVRTCIACRSPVATRTFNTTHSVQEPFNRLIAGTVCGQD